MDAACCYRCSVVRVFVCQKRAVIGALCVKNFSEGDEIMLDTGVFNKFQNSGYGKQTFVLGILKFWNFGI